MNVKEKVSYLEGLLEGSDLKFGKKEQKVVDTMMEVLVSLASSIEDLNQEIDNLYEGYDAVCDSLDAIEEDIDLIFDEDVSSMDFEDEDLEEMFYNVDCPKCNESICIDEETLLEGDILCPNCNEVLEFDFDCDCEDCDCKSKDSDEKEEAKEQPKEKKKTTKK